MSKIGRRKLKNLSINVYRGAKSYWRKYHFLVPPRKLAKDAKYLWSIVREGRNWFYDVSRPEEYGKWLEENEVEEDYIKQKYEPLLSVLIPVYNVEGKYLRECIESILQQSYQKFEICIVDDASNLSETLETLKKYAKNPKIKIKHRKKNGHISVATNDALKMAKGEFVVLMDDDDTISQNAFYEVVRVLNRDRKIDMIYTDEDKLDMEGRRCNPHLKPDYSPDTLMSLNYMSHLGVLRRSTAEEIGGFKKGFEGAQDYDLYLRFVEKTQRIYHLPKILYHWRMIPGSTAVEVDNKSYALERGKKAIEEALVRRKTPGTVEIAEDCPYYQVKYKIKGKPKVTIVIPTRDFAETTRKCLQSIYDETTYENYEVVVVNNNSEKLETFELFREFREKYKNFRVIDANFEFNYSKINNLAVRETKSDYIVLLNNDTEVITPEWLELMLGYAQLKHVGAVGAKLWYPDETIQHVGVMVGLGVGSHVFNGLERGEIGFAGRTSVPYDYGAVTAACLMVSRKKWEEVGGLEEDLKVAYNDVDFCLKLWKAGYYNVEVPMVELYHYESKSRGAENTEKKMQRFMAEQEYMMDKWGNTIKKNPFYNVNFSRRREFSFERKKVWWNEEKNS